MRCGDLLTHSPASRTRIETLQKRADFVAARAGGYASGAFVRVQTRHRDVPQHTRVGYTVTKKNGNAVVRNRIKRRLRAAIETINPLLFEPDRDYVVISKPQALTATFAALQGDLASAIARATRKSQQPSRNET